MVNCRVKPARTYYSDFSSYCIRFYADNPNPRFHTEAEKKNWYAVRNALNSFPEREQAILLALYRERDTIADNIYHLAKRNRVDQDVLWRLVSDFKKRTARKRGLI